MGKRSDIERHTVLCPICQHPILDHMNVCPHCGNEIQTSYFTEDKAISDKTKKLIRGIIIAVAVVLVVWFLIKKS